MGRFVMRAAHLDGWSSTPHRADPIAMTLEVEFIGEDGAGLCKKRYAA